VKDDNLFAFGMTNVDGGTACLYRAVPAKENCGSGGKDFFSLKTDGANF